MVTDWNSYFSRQRPGIPQQSPVFDFGMNDPSGQVSAYSQDQQQQDGPPEINRVDWNAIMGNANAAYQGGASASASQGQVNNAANTIAAGVPPAAAPTPPPAPQPPAQRAGGGAASWAQDGGYRLPSGEVLPGYAHSTVDINGRQVTIPGYYEPDKDRSIFVNSGRAESAMSRLTRRLSDAARAGEDPSDPNVIYREMARIRDEAGANGAQTGFVHLDRFVRGANGETGFQGPQGVNTAYQPQGGNVQVANGGGIQGTNGGTNVADFNGSNNGMVSPASGGTGGAGGAGGAIGPGGASGPGGNGYALGLATSKAARLARLYNALGIGDPARAHTFFGGLIKSAANKYEEPYLNMINPGGRSDNGDQVGGNIDMLARSMLGNGFFGDLRQKAQTAMGGIDWNNMDEGDQAGLMQTIQSLMNAGSNGIYQQTAATQLDDLIQGHYNQLDPIGQRGGDLTDPRNNLISAIKSNPNYRSLLTGLP